MSDIKTVLFLLEYPIDLPGGGQESTKTLCDGLAADGRIRPIVVCPKLLHTGAESYPFEIIDYESDENRELSKIKRITNLLGRVSAFYRIIKKVHPDLIHVQMSESLITFGFLRCLGIFADIPFVYTDRSLVSGYRRHSMICIQRTLRYASRLVTTTQYNADLWKDLTGTKITVIPNTISKSFGEYDPSARSAARARYGITDDETVIGFAGRISEEKDWGRVPAVVAAIRDAGIKIKVALVLSLYESTDEDTAAAIRSGITDITGPEGLIYMQDLSQDEMADYYYLVDIFVMTSCFESFGKAAVEAMSRKCIVMSTSVGGLPEVIGNTEDLYDMNDLSKLTERVKYLVATKEAFENEREYLYSRYKENYTVDKNISRHIDMYEEILN